MLKLDKVCLYRGESRRLGINISTNLKVICNMVIVVELRNKHTQTARRVGVQRRIMVNGAIYLRINCA